ncbi:hypothetical protein SAMN06265365_107211 [Tistlia consotensis]|uniref:Uncharacterized protein n=1 Tax=Tistlia consotensis USBA 355 TaxID=560819 RepID=A0A1Y6BFK1_9PROT|nr:hypothetical protein [Tistlia consotensis]SME98829.1 hypothetical protein SAMN05428998_102213 [Tistlia consotensis USBA 355]SNR58253.1 hypothetical protein SAMN06265365_107211 [Tistlia consotensis]
MESGLGRNRQSLDWRPGLGLLGRASQPTIRALSACFLPAGAVGTPLHRQVAHKVARKISLMPVFVAAPILVLTLLFELSARLRFGCAAGRLDGPRRAVLAGLWRRAPLGLLRDLVTVHERLTSFVYFEALRDVAEQGSPQP